jgi:hypothetical protein
LDLKRECEQTVMMVMMMGVNAYMNSLTAALAESILMIDEGVDGKVVVK